MAHSLQLGLGSYACTWQIGVPGYPLAQPMSAIGLIDRARELGLGLVQIDDNLPLENASEAELAAIEAHAKIHGVALEVGTRGSDPDRLRRFIPIAKRFASPFVRVVLDRGGDQPSVAESTARMIAVRGEYRAAGLLVAIENHDRFTIADLQALLRDAGDHVGICLDTVNSLGAAEGPKEVVEGLAPWVVNLHLKDFKVVRASHHMGFTVEGTPAGAGQLDISWTLERLRRAGRNFNAILELWTPPADTLSATIAHEQAWAHASMTHLRELLPASAFATATTATTATSAAAAATAADKITLTVP